MAATTGMATELLNCFNATAGRACGANDQETLAYGRTREAQRPRLAPEQVEACSPASAARAGAEGETLPERGGARYP